MNSSTLNLGYTVRRAIREPRDGLHVFSHDIGTFCIPAKHAQFLAVVYKRYLWASGILNWRSDPTCDAELYECDRLSLSFIHERSNRVIADGQFYLEDAIEFVEVESGISKAFAIRWCMMMEYITHEDQRLTHVPQTKQAQEPPECFVEPCLDDAIQPNEEMDHG